MEFPGPSPVFFTLGFLGGGFQRLGFRTWRLGFIWGEGLGFRIWDLGPGLGLRFIS